MNRFTLLLPLLILASLLPPAFAKVIPVAEEQLTASSEHKKIALVASRIIERYHYKKVDLDDQLSNRIWLRYLDALDPNRSFFTDEDISELDGFRDRMDDALVRGQLDPVFQVFKRYRTRVNQMVAYAQQLVERDFDFSKQENYRYDREDTPWVKDEVALRELWRKRVKNDTLTARLNGDQDEEIRSNLRQRYRTLADRINQLTADDVFQTFVNAYTATIDPHTSYMSASGSENFDISMRLSLEGIGAVLSTEKDHTVVQKTIKGGPAERSGLLKSGDHIIGVGQGQDGEMLDIVGWRLQDVVEKIRGPKGSQVRLRILPKSGGGIDAERKTITLVRDEIKLEEQAAQSKIIDDLPGMQGARIGVITVPTFYRDFRGEAQGDEEFRSTTRDVRRLLEDLKASKVDGILVDLRDNGGGSLSEATELTGLFIRQGPVVQVQDAQGKVELENDPDPDIAYSGPLAVLVDRNSASASEIFAGAIQDYGRGLIIGEPTFGKGTVQTLIRVDRFVPGEDNDLGRLRMTMAQFFRVNGESTQHRGVVPDLLFPTARFSDKHGERELDNALPWARIEPVRDVAADATNLAELSRRSSQRIARNAGFSMLTERESILKEMEKQIVVSLNEQERKAQSEQREKKLKKQRNDFLVSQGLPPVEDDADEENDEEVTDKQRDAILAIELNEAAAVLVDYINLHLKQSQVAEQPLF